MKFFYSLISIWKNCKKRKRIRSLKKEFFSVFGFEAEPKNQTLVEINLRRFWSSAEAILNHRPINSNLHGYEWEKAQGEPEKVAFTIYWKAEKIARELEFKIPNRA